MLLFFALPGTRTWAQWHAEDPVPFLPVIGHRSHPG